MFAYYSRHHYYLEGDGGSERGIGAVSGCCYCCFEKETRSEILSVRVHVVVSVALVWKERGRYRVNIVCAVSRVVTVSLELLVVFVGTSKETARRENSPSWILIGLSRCSMMAYLGLLEPSSEIEVFAEA